MSIGCKNSLVNRVTSCLFSYVVEFAHQFTGGGKKNSSTKIPRVVCLSHPCTLRHSSNFCGEGRQIRPLQS